MSFTLQAELSDLKARSLEGRESLKKEIDAIGERLDKLAERVQTLQDHSKAPPIRR
jgi:hypothetical protein